MITDEEIEKISMGNFGDHVVGYLTKRCQLINSGVSAGGGYRVQKE